jgi:hypothetical protein
VKALRNVYGFVTGGSIVAPIGLGCAIAAGIALPVGRSVAFLALVAIAFVASTLEKVT